MPRLALSLFGPVQFDLAGDQVTKFAYDKVQALLVLLATESDRAHRRETLAGLLWPNQEDSVARHNLNQALWSLRQTLGDRGAEHPVLLSSRGTIQFNPEADCLVDVRRFTDLFEQTRQHVHRRPETCRRCMTWREEAVGLYRGTFLEQFSLGDSPEFEEWVLSQRERFHQMVIEALTCLVDFHERRDNDQQAISYLRRLIELDPLREESHRRLMRLLARTGQRPAALAHFNRLSEMLRSDLDAEVEPETRAIRDEIEQRGSDNESGNVNLPDRTGPLFRLPSHTNPLIGRDKVLRRLADLIEGGEHRLATLIGPGGIGKTRLALQLANDEKESFSDGVCFVPLAGVESADSLIQAIVDARSLTFYSNVDPREQLLDDLHDQDLLLVLDNFEHLLDGVDLLPDILDQAPNVQILVTSRERLNLYGEHVFPVQALDIPSASDGAHAIERSGAVQLFVRSAQRANTGFNAQLSDLSSIVRVCELVGGMPLGIELAAAWSPLLTCREIAQEIERSLDFLTTSLRDVPERHRSVRAAFDHSWRLLTDHERDVYTRLSVFRGGFRKEAAKRVAGATLPTLLALMSKSFLTRDPLGRFEIHELLRQYAADKLDELHREKEATQDAHARYYADFLFEREQRLKGNQHHMALEELIAESENVRAAWTWALGQSRFEILQTLVHVWLFYEVTGRYQELIGLVVEAAHVLEQSADERSEVALGRALTRRAGSLLRIGIYEDSEAILRRSNDIMARHGELAEISLNHNFLAMSAHGNEDFQREERLLEESICTARLAGDQWLTAYSLNDLGMVALLLGDPDRAQQFIQESLEIMIAIDDLRGRAFALNNLGTVMCRLGSYDEALHLHRQSLQIRRQIENRWGEAQSLAQIGVVARAMGDPTTSGERLRAALRIASDLRAYPLVLDVLAELADLFVLQGDEERALTIMAKIAGHPASGPSIRSRARKIRDTLADTHFSIPRTELDSSMSMSDLDEVIDLALGKQPKATGQSILEPIGKRDRHSMR